MQIAETRHTGTRRPPSSCIRSITRNLEVELERELHLSRCERTQDVTHLREIKVARLCLPGKHLRRSESGEAADSGKVWVIKGIKEFDSELKIPRLRKVEILHQRQVGVEVARTEKNIAPGVAVSPLSRQAKAAVIDPIRGRVGSMVVWIAD